MGVRLEGRLSFGPAVADAAFSGTSLITIRPSSCLHCKDGAVGVWGWCESIAKQLLGLSESYNAGGMIAGIVSNSQALLNDRCPNSLLGDPDYKKC